LFNQQETCEAKVEFASGANPDFAAACVGEAPSPCSTACSALADCAVEACTGYAPEDKAAIKVSCETSCTPELAAEWSVLSCAEQITAFSLLLNHSRLNVNKLKLLVMYVAFMVLLYQLLQV